MCRQPEHVFVKFVQSVGTSILNAGRFFHSGSPAFEELTFININFNAVYVDETDC